MCLILFAYEAHPAYRLVVAANRDEFYERPTERAGFWAEAPGVLAGRDLLRGGTWLGVTRGGRFAAVTNYREPGVKVENAESRGALVAEFLKSGEPAGEYTRRLAERGAAYNGFNLLAGDARGLYYFSNRGGPPRELGPGVYGLSNALLDTPWPKVVRGRRALAEVIKSGDALAPEAVTEVLLDRVRAADAELPETGVGLEVERVLSPLFIASPGYGTRCTTVLLLGRAGRLTFAERTFEAGAEGGEARYEFNVNDAKEEALGQR